MWQITAVKGFIVQAPTQVASWNVFNIRVPNSGMLVGLEWRNIVK
jgi:hypothetical protein